MINKFNELTEIKTNNQNEVPQAIKNISDRNLDDDEKSVLAKGLNFSLGNRKKDTLQLIAQVEPVIEDLKLDKDEKTALR